MLVDLMVDLLNHLLVVDPLIDLLIDRMIYLFIDFIVLNRSREWLSLDPKTRQDLGIVNKEDGEFWY